MIREMRLKCGSLAFIALFLFLKGVSCGCGVYGEKPCPYVPAPPGESPPCAKPGHTYCEYPTHYPREQIKHLLSNMRVDPRALLADESKHEFYYQTKIPHAVYGPPQAQAQNQNQNQINNHGGKYYPDATYGALPPGYPSNTYDSVGDGSFTYNRSEANFFGNAHNYLGFNKYQGNKNYEQFYRYNVPQYFTNGWTKWNRNDKFYGQRKKRAINKIRRWYAGRAAMDPVHGIKKRQAEPRTLCETRSNYIMPRAAMNNKGNWMYVVNLPEVDNGYTQLVKSETCATEKCSGLCSVPDDYTSRCEQKYVQKRLIAMEGAGGQLYNDVFWFPSCCICTIV